MQSLFNFIIQPKNGRYTNTVKIGKKELIINTSIEDHKFVNRVGIVKSIPLVGKTNINVNDEVIVHHNVFRRFYDIRGNEKNSTSYFREDLYFCYPDQIFLYKNKKKWKAPYDFCFVKPLAEKNKLSVNKEQKHIGVIKYGNDSLKAVNVKEKDIVCFTPNSEYEFIIDNNRLYRMKTRDIAIKYEYKKNESEYNTSWASGG